jgi:hypothetical protein
MPYEKMNDQDISDALALANQSTQELRGAKTLAREQAMDNRSWSDYANDVGNTLYGMKDIGLFRDIIPGAIQSAKQAFTLPARAYRGEVPEDQRIAEALNFAGMVTGGAGAVPAELNALRAGASVPIKKFSMVDAAKAEGTTPKKLSKGLSKIARPQEEWRYSYKEPVNAVQPQQFDPNILKPGDVFVPLFGDRTISGRTITEIGGNKLAKPVITEGGPTYMLNPNNQIWASGQSIISGIANKAEGALRASEKLGYKDPAAYGIYVPMGKASGDFSTHTADAIISMLPNAPITAKAAKAFDDVIKKKLPDFPGIQSPKLREYLMEPGAGAKRIIFSKAMDKKPWREAGFPDVGEARFATTNPDLLSTPDYAGGYSIGRIDREAPVIKKPVMGHGSYPVALGGEYVGGLPVSLHKDFIFPNWTSYYDRVMNPERANYGPAKYKSYANVMAYQPFGPRTIADFQERILKAQGKAEGGAVGDADIEAAMQTARQHFEGGGVAINQDQIDEGIIAANQSLQELRGAKQAVRDEAASNQSWGDWASQMGQNLYGMKDIGLFHDIVPGTIEAAKQAATMPYRQQMAAASGQPWNEQQQIGEAFNTAGMFTLGAGAIPAEANALRAGAGMYSKAERAALGLPMEKMQGPQALAMLGKAGIGPEELQWTGLADRLPQTSQLTKQQLVDMIRQNDVNLDEVNLGFTPIAQRHDELLNKKLNDTLTEAEEKEYQELAHSVDLGYGQNEPKYMQYALPGGKNYQETLVTLDANKTFRNYTDKLFNEYVADVAKNFTDEGASSDRAISLATKMANALAEKVEWATMARALGKEDEYMDVFNKTPDNFQSKHWSEQNVLAHIRTNQFDGFENGKYFTPASEKVFNLDELQSDWAQKGRQDGFTDRSQDWPDQYNDFRKKMVEEWVAKKAKTAFDENPELFNNNFDQAAEIAYQVAKQKGASKIAEDLGMSAEHTQLYNKANSYYNSVPLAPYVQSTNQWADLGLKKAVSQAIDSGSDVFTWTPGKVSADRYDLSRQVRKIHFLQNDDGTFHVGTELPDGTEFNQASGVMDLEKIEKTFGKEIAKKVKNGEFTGADNNVSYIEGKDLAVGGKGMIDFYDNIVPKRLSEIIRKATGEKPQFQTWTIQTADGPMEVQGLRLTPEMKAKLQAIKEKEGGYFPHMAYGGKVDDNSVNKALRIAAEASV